MTGSLIDTTTPVVCYHGSEVLVLRKYSDEMIEIYPVHKRTKIVWGAGYKRGSALNRWVKLSELQPADCTCDERSGISCRACQDWNRIANGDEMPF